MNNGQSNQMRLISIMLCFYLLLNGFSPVFAKSSVAEITPDPSTNSTQSALNTSWATNKDYRSTPGVYGTITSVGSDTLASLMAIWAQRFQELYPHITFQIQASGSSTASKALTQGSASIGPMSREMSGQEQANFIKRHGYAPTMLTVAIDAIAIYAEKNSPISQLTLREVDALFSITQLCGASHRIRLWSQLQVVKYGDSQPIQLFGRNSASGTYDLFKQKALCDGDFAPTVNEMPSSSSVLQSVASSIGGLGYAALGYTNDNVKALALSAGSGAYYLPTPANLRDGHYPFTRNLYIVVNKPPGQSLATLERTFLRFILSQEGQEIVEDNGYFSVPEQIIEHQLLQL
jgi:phosphate transport system substrate-binding protein